MSELVQGAVALLDGERWVIRHLEPDVATVVREFVTRVVDTHDLSPVVSARNQVACLTCGRTWIQRGNRTGHCAKCHSTFEGGTLWDAHQIVDARGRVVCKDAARMVFRGHRLVRTESGSWRGVGPDQGVFGGAA